jgi:hypothetical protein
MKSSLGSVDPCSASLKSVDFSDALDPHSSSYAPTASRPPAADSQHVAADEDSASLSVESVGSSDSDSDAVGPCGMAAAGGVGAGAGAGSGAGAATPPAAAALPSRSSFLT